MTGTSLHARMLFGWKLHVCYVFLSKSLSLIHSITGFLPLCYVFSNFPSRSLVREERDAKSEKEEETECEEETNEGGERGIGKRGKEETEKEWENTRKFHSEIDAEEN